jgi:hypothetical protein
MEIYFVVRIQPVIIGSSPKELEMIKGSRKIKEKLEVKNEFCYNFPEINH